MNLPTRIAVCAVFLVGAGFAEVYRMNYLAIFLACFAANACWYDPPRKL